MNETKLHTIDEEPIQKRKTLTLPVLGVIIFGGLLFWTFNHIAGGCTSASQVLSYCHAYKFPVLPTPTSH